MTPKKVLSQLEGHIQEISACTKKFTRMMNEYSELMSKLLKVTTYEREGVKSRLVLILHEFGSKQELQSRVESLRLEMEADRELAELIKVGEASLKAGCFKCRKCRGAGRLTKTRYLRDRGAVRPYLATEDCPICGGGGNIEIPAEFQSYISFYLEAVTKVFELGKAFMKVSGDTMSLLPT